MGPAPPASGSALRAFGITGFHLERVVAVAVADVLPGVAQWKRERTLPPLAHVRQLMLQQPARQLRRRMHDDRAAERDRDRGLPVTGEPAAEPGNPAACADHDASRHVDRWVDLLPKHATEHNSCAGARRSAPRVGVEAAITTRAN